MASFDATAPRSCFLYYTCTIQSPVLMLQLPGASPHVCLPWLLQNNISLCLAQILEVCGFFSLPRTLLKKRFVFYHCFRECMFPFRRWLQTLATSTFVFGDSYTLWQPPPSFSTTRTHIGHLQFVFDNTYTSWQPPVRPPPSFLTSVLHTLTSTFVFDGSYTLWATSETSMSIFDDGVVMMMAKTIRTVEVGSRS